MNKAKSPHRAQALLALLSAVFFWGTSAVFLRTTALSLAPENALSLRYIVLVPLLAGGLFVSGRWQIARVHWPSLALTSSGMLGSAWFTIQGFARVAAGLGTVIQMVEPIIIALLAFVFIGEGLTRRLWVGLGIAIGGGLIIFWPDLNAATQHPLNGWGVAALLCASTSWAAYTIGAKPLLAVYSGFTITAWSTLIAAPVVFLLASKPYSELLFHTATSSWMEIFYLAVFNSILGNVLWTFGTRHIAGAAVGSFLYVLPLFAILAGYLWLGEAVTPSLVVGGLIVLAGVALAQSRSHKV